MDLVEAAVARNRMIVVALAAGVLVLAAVTGFVEVEPVPFAVRATLPAALAGLLALVVGWRVYTKMVMHADGAEVEAGLARYSAALLTGLAITEGAAFIGVACYMLGGGIEAMTGVVTHIMLSGVLWPTAEKARPGP